MDYIIYIYTYVVRFTYFLCERGGAVNFGSLFSFIIDFFVFSVMTSISSVETPVDRRRFVFSSVFVAYWASYRTTTPSSSHSSFTFSNGYLLVYFDVHSG